MEEGIFLAGLLEGQFFVLKSVPSKTNLSFRNNQIMWIIRMLLGYLIDRIPTLFLLDIAFFQKLALKFPDISWSAIHNLPFLLFQIKRVFFALLNQILKNHKSRFCLLIFLKVVVRIMRSIQSRIQGNALPISF